MSESQRIYELDSLRGIAAIAVVVFHFTTKYAELFNTNLTLNFIDFKYGHYGVQLFFIISGFVIFMTMNKISSASDFIYKRFIRLYPIFWICLIITSLVTFNFPPGFGRNISDFLVSFTMIPSLLGFRPIDGVYWSLVPELFFYLMMVVLYITKSVDKILWVGFGWLALMIFNYFLDFPVYFQFIFNLKFGMLFLTGINFYKIFIKKDTFLNHFQILICLLITFLDKDRLFPIFFFSFNCIFYLFVYGYLKFLRINFLMFLGKISYSFYLLHQFIGFTIIYFLINYCKITNGILLLVCPILLTLILSIIVTLKIEIPLTNKLRKFDIFHK